LQAAFVLFFLIMNGIKQRLTEKKGIPTDGK